MNTPRELSLAEQQAIARRIVALAAELENGCDVLLKGHCLHLRERAEAIGVILETTGEGVG